MSKAKSDQLFNLIKTLSKGEKRFFKLYASRLGNSSDKKFIVLYNAIEKQKIYNEDQILLKEKDLELNGLKQDFQKLNQKLQENKEKYEEETRLLKKVHSAEMMTVNALSESVKKEWDYVNLDKVLTDFPNIQSEFKTIVFQKVEKALAEQRCKNSEYVDQLLIGHQNQISELLKSFEAEKETWRKERNAEILALSTKLKNTCSDAYSSSISRVQSHIESEKKKN